MLHEGAGFFPFFLLHASDGHVIWSSEFLYSFAKSDLNSTTAAASGQQ